MHLDSLLSQGLGALVSIKPGVRLTIIYHESFKNEDVHLVQVLCLVVRVPDVSPVVHLVRGADPHFLKLYFQYLGSI